VVYVEPHPRRIQAFRNGAAVIDTERALLVHRRNHPLKLRISRRRGRRSASEPVAEAPGFVHVPWDAVDTWTEEGRTLVHYPPNPYHRVDCRPTTRRLRVTLAGTTLVDTDDTVIVFETALGTPALRRPGTCAHGASSAVGYVDLLQLQGVCQVLVGGRGRNGDRGRGVELPGPATGEPADQRFLREIACRRRGAAEYIFRLASPVGIYGGTLEVFRNMIASTRSDWVGRTIAARGP